MHKGLPDEPITAGTYLAEEVRSPARREYVGGTAYAMAGASNAHNQVATNILVALGGRLRGSPCRAFNSDTKVRILLPSQLRFAAFLTDHFGEQVVAERRARELAARAADEATARVDEASAPAEVPAVADGAPIAPGANAPVVDYDVAEANTVVRPAPRAASSEPTPKSAADAVTPARAPKRPAEPAPEAFDTAKLGVAATVLVVIAALLGALLFYLVAR